MLPLCRDAHLYFEPSNQNKVIEGRESQGEGGPWWVTLSKKGWRGGRDESPKEGWGDRDETPFPKRGVGTVMSHSKGGCKAGGGLHQSQLRGGGGADYVNLQAKCLLYYYWVCDLEKPSIAVGKMHRLTWTIKVHLHQSKYLINHYICDELSALLRMICANQSLYSVNAISGNHSYNSLVSTRAGSMGATIEPAPVVLVCYMLSYSLRFFYLFSYLTAPSNQWKVGYTRLVSRPINYNWCFL